MRENVRVYGRGADTRICFGEWVQVIFPLLGLDDVKFALRDDNVYEWNGVVDIILFVPIKNGSCTKAHVEEAGNDTDDLLITKTPQIIVVSTG